MHEHAANFDDVLEPLPATVRLRERLLDRPGALRAAHFPVGEDDQEQGRRRLAFEELLLDQLALQQRRRNRAANATAPRLAGPRELTARWLDHELPFPLTGDQRAALEEIDADIARAEPMQRLLMGEVGSGKTVVALYAMLAGGRARLPGGADGADRDAGRAALPDGSAAARFRAGHAPVC